MRGLTRVPASLAPRRYVQISDTEQLLRAIFNCTRNIRLQRVGKYISPIWGKSADCTEHENDVIFFVFLATVFGNLEVWKVKK